MHVKEKMEGQVAILTPKGYLVGGEETEELSKKITALFEAKNRCLVLDLGETQHINATTLGIIITAEATYRRAGGRVHIARLDQRIKNIFVTTKLSLLFKCFDSSEEAIAAFAA